MAVSTEDLGDCFGGWLVYEMVGIVYTESGGSGGKRSREEILQWR